MKVLHLGKYYYPAVGGIESQLRNLNKGLKELNVDQEVVVANTRCETSIEEVDGVKIVRLSNLVTLLSTPICFGWRRYIESSDYDILHLHLPNPMASLHLYKKKIKGRLVISYHSDIVRQRLLKYPVYLITKWLFTRADAIIIAGDDAGMYDRLLHGFSSKCVSIPYGVDTDFWGGQKKSFYEIQKIRSTYKRPIVLFVGRLVYYKGLEFLISAMKDVEGALLIVGRGEEEKRLKRLTGKMGLDDRVFFPGFVSEKELAHYYHACDLFCLPSVARSEAFGIVQQEAMACGKPVVSTEIGTATSVVNVHGKTGFVVPPRDQGALSSALNRLIEDRSLAEEMGRNAKEHVRKRYDNGIVADRVLKLYRDILGRPGRRVVNR